MPSLLLVTTVYPPSIGGPSLQTREIALVLARLGWRTAVLTFRVDGEPPRDVGVELQLVEEGDRRRRSWLVRNLALGRAADEVLTRLRPDLVHVQACDGNLAWLVGMAARARRIPRIVKFSADFVWNRLNRDRYLGIPYHAIHKSSLKARALTEVQRYTFRLYDIVWATSPFQEDALIRIYRLPRSRIRLLPNLVSTSELVPPPRGSRSGKPFTALLVSRIVPWKGIDDAILALAEPPAREARLRIVGGGSPTYQRHLQELAGRSGVADRVDFVGPVDPTRISREFASADVFLLPSRYEPFGIVFVQAMAAGLPVVATNVGGIPSVVEDGATGMLVPPDSPVSVGAALGTLAGDPVLRQRMGERARSASAAFSVEHRIQDLVAMYAPLLAERTAPGTSRA